VSNVDRADAIGNWGTLTRRQDRSLAESTMKGRDRKRGHSSDWLYFLRPHQLLQSNTRIADHRIRLNAHARCGPNGRGQQGVTLVRAPTTPDTMLAFNRGASLDIAWSA
jgi:hypothetical protein